MRVDSVLGLVVVVLFAVPAMVVAGGLPGDFDGDSDVDLADFEAFSACVGGVAVPVGDPACFVFDFDADNDVDLLDWCVFQGVFTGSHAPLIVDAGVLEAAHADLDGYFGNGNDLSGTVMQEGFDTVDFDIEWIVESQPPGSGVVQVFDSGATESGFVVSPPAREGEYVFRLSAVNTITQQAASDTVTLFLEDCRPIAFAGVDRTVSVLFQQAGTIVFSTAGVPLLEADAFDPCGDGSGLQYQWSVLVTPDPERQPNDTVELMHPFSPGDGVHSGDVLISPPGFDVELTLLRSDGSTTTQSNTILPGPYVFEVTVTCPVCGQSDSDFVIRTITPTWTAQAATFGSLAGLAPAGGIRNQVIAPDAIETANFLSLSRVNGLIAFLLSDNDDALGMFGPFVQPVVADDGIEELMIPNPAVQAGTYTFRASLAAGKAGTSYGDTGVNLLVGTDLEAGIPFTQLDITAAQIGAPQSSAGGRLYAGRAYDDLGSAANSTANSEALRGQNILFADIKNNGDLHLIVWGGDDANNNYDAQDVRIYGPVNNQVGNANTLDIERENFVFLEQIDTGCTVSDVAIGPLRGNAARPEIVVVCHAADPLVKIYHNNGTTGLTDKVYSVTANQTAAATPTTITLDYLNSNVASLPPRLKLAPFTSTLYYDLILGDPGFDASADGFIEGLVAVLQGGPSGAIPVPGFSVATGVLFDSLPVGTWKIFTGSATDADDEEFFGFSLASGSFTDALLHDIYVGAPGNDAATSNNADIPGSVYRIPAGTALDGVETPATQLGVAWAGEADGDQFGFNVATTASGQVCVAATQNGHTANTANGNGKVYVYPAATANAAGAGTIPGLAGEQASDFFGQRLATGMFEGGPVLLAASPGGNYFKIIRTGGTLTNPIVAMTKVTIADVDTTQILVIGDINGDGKNDVLTSEQDRDLVTVLWGRE